MGWLSYKFPDEWQRMEWWGEQGHNTPALMYAHNCTIELSTICCFTLYQPLGCLLPHLGPGTLFLQSNLKLHQPIHVPYPYFITSCGSLGLNLLPPFSAWAVSILLLIFLVSHPGCRIVWFALSIQGCTEGRSAPFLNGCTGIHEIQSPPLAIPPFPSWWSDVTGVLWQVNMLHHAVKPNHWRTRYCSSASMSGRGPLLV